MALYEGLSHTPLVALDSMDRRARDGCRHGRAAVVGGRMTHAIAFKRGKCLTCDAFFRGNAFTRHRVLVNQGWPPQYRCLSAGEMKRAGMRLDPQGFWCLASEAPP